MTPNKLFQEPLPSSKSLQTPQKIFSDLKLVNSPEKQMMDIFNQLVRELTPKKILNLPSEADQLTPYPQNDIFSSQFASQGIQQQLNEINYLNQFNTVKKGQLKPNYREENNISAIFDTVQRVQSKMVTTNPCHCSKSKCLKKYCDCFKSGLICGKDCQCIGCQNTQLLKQHVQKQNATIKCKCSKSHCLKNYCQCHHAGRSCGSQCNCMNCQNQEEDHNLRDTPSKKIKVNQFHIPKQDS